MTREQFILEAYDLLSEGLAARLDHAEIVARIDKLIGARLSSIVPEPDPADRVAVLIEQGAELDMDGLGTIDDSFGMTNYKDLIAYGAENIVKMCATWDNSEKDKIVRIATGLHSSHVAGINFATHVLYQMIPRTQHGGVMNTPVAGALCAALATIEARSDMLVTWRMRKSV